ALARPAGAAKRTRRRPAARPRHADKSGVEPGIVAAARGSPPARVESGVESPISRIPQSAHGPPRASSDMGRGAEGLEKGHSMRVESPQIPYNFADLEPAMSRDTLVFHFLHHQRDCFDRMLSMVRGTELETLPLAELVCACERDPERRVLFRHAAEVWNHDLYWRSMLPGGGGGPRGRIGGHIAAPFGSY